jgi:aflatoxin B1 aldehyde reductase
MPNPPQKQPPKLILGCSNFGSPTDPHCKITTAAQAASILTTFTSYGHNTIDTSRRYPPQAPGTSEELLGEALKLLSQQPDTAPDTNEKNVAASIKIDTKTLSLPGDHHPDRLSSSISSSLTALGLSSVHTIYLHFPDRSVPFSLPISTLSHAVSSGQATQWGLSNYTISDLREILSLCAQHNWIKPAIYQGEYNALNRSNEALVEFCHDNGIAFYAYSPGAGGVFAEGGSRIEAATPAGQRVRALYGGEAMQDAIGRVRDVTGRMGLGGHETVLRWAFWDGVLDGRFGDGVVAGTSGEKQLRATCEFLGKGGLNDDLRETVEQVWGAVKE